MASGDQYVELKVETSPNGESGTAAVSSVAMFQPIQEFALNPSVTFDDRTDEFRGTAEPIPPDLTGYNQTEGTAKGRLYPRLIGMYFTPMLGYVTPTAGGTAIDPDGGTVPAGVYLHQWNSSTLDPATIRSVQIRRSYGNTTSLFFKDTGVTVTQLDLAVGDQNQPSTFEASLAGLFQDDTVDPSLSPSYDAVTVKPFYRGNFSVSTFLTGTGSPLNANFSFTNPVEPDPVLNSSPWPSAWSRPNEAGAVPRLTINIDAKSIDPDDYAAFMGNTIFGYKMKWVSTQNAGTASYKYRMWIEGCATFSAYEMEAMQHKLRHGATITAVAGASGGTAAFKVTLANDVSSYSSVS